MRNYLNLWHIKNGVIRVHVYPMEQQRGRGKGPITVYRDAFGVTYSGKYIRKWEELSPAQQCRAYRDVYESKRADALFRIAKEPDLESQWGDYKLALKAERDEAIAAIERGEPVPPPKYIWE